MSHAKNLLILIIALGFAVGVTTPKLYKMFQIKGWVSGAATDTVTITQKWHQVKPKKIRPNVFWIAWTDRSIREVGDHRINLQRERWNALEVGATLEIIKAPGDPVPYLREGIFVSPGNFVLDFVLLAAEIGAAVVMIRRLYRALCTIQETVNDSRL